MYSYMFLGTNTITNHRSSIANMYLYMWRNWGALARELILKLRRSPWKGGSSESTGGEGWFGGGGGGGPCRCR